MNRFCLLTAGRSGSTSLINAIASNIDVSVPNKHIKCPDNEILNPRRFDTYAERYAKATGTHVLDANQLLNLFFLESSGSNFAGFKCMPCRDRIDSDFIKMHRLTPIVLQRKDVASEVASFIIASEHGTWTRTGEDQSNTFRFDSLHLPRVKSFVDYIFKTKLMLDRISDAIRVYYEDLCLSGGNRYLNEYFHREIYFTEPRLPTSAKTYVENWPDFSLFVEEYWNHLLRAKSLE